MDVHFLAHLFVQLITPTSLIWSDWHLRTYISTLKPSLRRVFRLRPSHGAINVS